MTQSAGRIIATPAAAIEDDATQVTSGYTAGECGVALLHNACPPLPSRYVYDLWDISEVFSSP